MSGTQNTRPVPIRAIIMILISLAIIFAAMGVYGVITHNDDPQAALNAQEAVLKSAAPAATSEATAPATVCLISVARASLGDTTDRLTEAGVELQKDTDTWPARPAAPKVTTVYYDPDQKAAAQNVAKHLPGAAVHERPEGLQACAGAVAVAVVKK